MPAPANQPAQRRSPESVHNLQRHSHSESATSSRTAVPAPRQPRQTLPPPGSTPASTASAPAPSHQGLHFADLAPATSVSGMIGSTPSFYDPGQAMQPHTIEYEHFLQLQQQSLRQHEQGQAQPLQPATHFHPEGPFHFDGRAYVIPEPGAYQQPFLQNAHAHGQLVPPVSNAPRPPSGIGYSDSSFTQLSQSSNQVPVSDSYYYPTDLPQSHSFTFTPPEVSTQPLQPPGLYFDRLTPSYTPRSDSQPLSAYPSSNNDSSTSTPPRPWADDAQSTTSSSNNQAVPRQTQAHVQPYTQPSAPPASTSTLRGWVSNAARPAGGRQGTVRTRGPGIAGTGPRKRTRKADVIEESDSDSEDEADIFAALDIPVSRFSAALLPTRLPGACTHCKKLKMRCEFPDSENVCKRCKSGGHRCVVEGRKPRSAPNKREYLLAQLRQKDAIIESLLKQLHNPYMATPLSIAAYRMASSPSDSAGSRSVVQWLERLQSSVRNAGSSSGTHAFRLVSRMSTQRRDPQNDDSDTEVTERRTLADDDNSIDRLGGSRATSAEIQTNDDNPSLTLTSETIVQSDSLPNDSVPLGLIANLSLDNRSTKGRSSNAASVADLVDAEQDGDNDIGVASATYFMRGPASNLDVRKQLIERHSPPEILVHGIVTEEDVEKLFAIFYEWVNPFLSILDPVLHTPASTFARCPFLFTVICAISSRYYHPEKSPIYAIAMHFAKHAAATALIDGWKSVELCQAYILMAVYAVPARRWEEDRSWLYIGLAIRLATDLNLHIPPSSKQADEHAEREMLNRMRVWMICFNLDRSTATQFGKPYSIKEDVIMRHSESWYNRSQYNHPYDIHLCCYSTLLRIVSKFHEEVYSDLESPTSLNENIDFHSVIPRHDEKLEEFYQEWTLKFKRESVPNNRACHFRNTLLPFLVNYSRLVMFSFGFQQAFRRGLRPGDDLFFQKCLDSASNVIKCMVDSLAPSGYLRYAPDGHFVFAAFASAFLLKLLRPDFSHLLTTEQATQIFSLIQRLIKVLASPDVAIDDRHTPKLYSRFLAGLLAKHQPDGNMSGRSFSHQPEGHIPEAGSSTYPQSNIGGTQQVFQVSSVPGNDPSHQYGHSMSHGQSMVNPTAIYEPEVNYAVESDSFAQDGMPEFGMSGQQGMSDDEMLATMQAIRNPSFWENVMMPGFSWPETNAGNQYVNGYGHHAASYNGHNGAYPHPVMSQTPQISLY